MPKSFLNAIALGMCVLMPIAASDAVLTGDSHITSTNAAANFGAQATMNVGSGASGLLRFNLATLPPALTPAMIAKSTLLLYASRVTTAGNLSVSLLTGSFIESTVTYSNGSGLISATPFAGPIPLVSAQAGTYIAVDVTSQVQAALLSGSVGFALQSDGTLQAQFDSKENTITSHPAELRITLSGPQGPQGIQGIQGIQGVQGPQGPVGPAGPGSNFSYIVTSNVTVPPSGGLWIPAQCPTGTAIGGGCFVPVDAGSADLALLSSHRSESPADYGWYCFYVNRGTVARTFHVEVSCSTPVAAGSAAFEVRAERPPLPSAIVKP